MQVACFSPAFGMANRDNQLKLPWKRFKKFTELTTHRLSRCLCSTYDSGQIEMTNKTGTYLQHLNEDCLLEIFSSQSLTLMDLCSLAETCKRFKRITQRIFPKEFDFVGGDKSDSYRFKSKNHSEYFDTVQDVKRILKSFGGYLSKLSLYRDQYLVNPVAKYCGTVALTSLRIYKLKIRKGFILKLKSIFQRLLELSIISCDLTEVVTCPLINCDSLIELEMVTSTGCAAILNNTFPKLERLIFTSSEIPCTHNKNYNAILLTFIGRHKRIKSLNLSTRTHYCYSELLLGVDFSRPVVFSNLLPELKMLDVAFEITNYSRLIKFLKELKSLETLKLRSRYQKVPVQIVNVLPELENLRELHLEFCYFNGFPLSKLTQLKKIFLYRPVDDFYANDLINIIRQLTNLEEFEFHKFQMFRLSKRHFFEIAEIVEQRSNVLTIKSYLDKSLLNICDKNLKVRLINSDI